MAGAAPDAPDAAGPTVLRLDGITKRFGALVANDAISLTLRRGEALALLGENGAGKTTLMSILFGHYSADAGTIEAFGRTLAPGSPRDAIAAGIGMVHQHFTLADNLTVLDNVVLGAEPLWSLRSDRAAAARRLRDMAARFGLEVDPDAPVGRLSVGERQRVEILKALYRDARILILDEPTAVLTPQESARLFATLRRLTADGLSLILISHKLAEVMAASDRVAVLRGGRLVAERRTADTDRAELAELMVGRRVEAPAAQPLVPAGPVFELAGVSVAEDGRLRLDRADLTVRGREIVGVAGVSGNGQTALSDLAAGIARPSAGTMWFFGRDLGAPGPARLVAAGVGRIPEDRHAAGAVGAMTVWENAILERYRGPAFARLGLLRRGAARAYAAELIRRFDVRCPGPDSRAGLMSGGNLQKLILGRVLTQAPRFLLANQPTRGLDVGAIAYVHQRLLEAREAGAGILLISEDLDEVLALADRVAVLHRGRLTPARPRAEVSVAELGLAMAGQAGAGQAGAGQTAGQAGHAA